MPLSIPLPARAKVIINGAVIENSGSANITLTVHNKANILRDKDVLTQAEADTPAKEIYHSIQNAYLFESNKDEWLTIAAALMDGFERLAPASSPLLDHVRELIAEDKLYNALRASRRLIQLEGGESVGVPESPRPQKPGGGTRSEEIGRIKGQIAELERRIAALDQSG